jgi:dihydrofolate reductase
MRISLIVAVSENWVIGRGGDLPWHLSSDLKRFKRLTMGHHIIMGRKTFESIRRPLPGRTTIVITRQNDYAAGGALVVRGIGQALRLAGDDEEVFICGGAEIYKLALPHVDRIYLTRVHATVDGDTKFPALESTQWKIVAETHHWASEMDDFDHTYQVLDRVAPPVKT